MTRPQDDTPPSRRDRHLAAIFAADVAGYSRLMGRDEIATLDALASHRVVMDGEIARYGGRIANTAGDSVLAEFPSALDAVLCALVIQDRLHDADMAVPKDRRVSFRIGIHVGDVLPSGADLLGDGVNIASRLQSIAEPGGVCLSAPVADIVRDKLDRPLADGGDHQLKNISRPLRVFRLGPRAAPRLAAGEIPKQEIRFCRSQDGVRLAWARSGSGKPLMKTANWLNHLQNDWDNPIFGHIFAEFGRTFSLYRYDARGNGLSDWDVENLSFDTFVADLETVVNAAGLERFPLFGMSQGVAVSIAYAVRHPERVSHLVLYGGFALGGHLRSEAERAKREAMTALMRLAWDADEPTFRQMFASQMLPDATKEQLHLFNEHQRRSTSGACAARYFETVGHIDVRGLLTQVKAPTLVLHQRGDLVAPIEQSREIAGGIAGATFVTLPGRNHLILDTDEAWGQFFEEIRTFLET